jgi:hypothetical protein
MNNARVEALKEELKVITSPMCRIGKQVWWSTGGPGGIFPTTRSVLELRTQFVMHRRWPFYLDAHF